jgi:putative oxidoreductase
VTNQGYEYNLVLIAAVISLAETGPGSPSVDSAIGAKWHGPAWAFRALLVGILGAIGAHIIAEIAPAPEPAPAEATAESNGGAAPQAEAESAQSA